MERFAELEKRETNFLRTSQQFAMYSNARKMGVQSPQPMIGSQSMTANNMWNQPAPPPSAVGASSWGGPDRWLCTPPHQAICASSRGARTGLHSRTALDAVTHT